MIAGFIISFFEERPQQNFKEIQQEISAQAIQEFEKNPDVVKKQIADLIKNKQYSLATTKAERLLYKNDEDILNLYNQAIGAEQKDRDEETAKLSKVKAAQNSALVKALAVCKKEIADYFDVSGAGAIPDVKNFGSEKEFVFGWPRGSFQLQTAFGLVDMSASCDGTLNPFKLVSLSINGKTIILNGNKIR